LKIKDITLKKEFKNLLFLASEHISQVKIREYKIHITIAICFCYIHVITETIQ